jgi:hypothetical protein
MKAFQIALVKKLKIFFIFKLINVYLIIVYNFECNIKIRKCIFFKLNKKFNNFKF